MIKTPRTKHHVAFMIIPALFVIVGIAVLPYGIRNLKDSLSSRSWPTTNGIIEHSSVESHSDTFHADILYTYTIGSTNYTGTRVSLSDYGTGGPSHARRISHRYPEGETVLVYYKPLNPEVAILEPGLRLPAIIIILFSLLFIFLGIRTGTILRREYIIRIDTEQKHEPDCS